MAVSKPPRFCGVHIRLRRAGFARRLHHARMTAPPAVQRNSWFSLVRPPEKTDLRVSSDPAA